MFSFIKCQRFQFLGRRKLSKVRFAMKFLQYFGIAIIFLGFLASQVKSLLSTTGYAYEPVSGDEQEGNLSSEIFTAYHECWGMEECGYVAKRKNDGQFVKLKIGATLNNTKYSHIWKKRTEGNSRADFINTKKPHSIVYRHFHYDVCVVFITKHCFGDVLQGLFANDSFDYQVVCCHRDTVYIHLTGSCGLRK